MDPLIIPIAALAIPVVIVPTALTMKYAQRKRELEHAERMRALELGRTLPQDESWWSPARLGLAIAVIVPLGVFFCAAIATAVEGYEEKIWLAPTIVSVMALMCGSYVASRGLGARAHSDAYSTKPPMEDDVFDVAGARG